MYTEVIFDVLEGGNVGGLGLVDWVGRLDGWCRHNVYMSTLMYYMAKYGNVENRS